jgi:GxxExxY protein
MGRTEPGTASRIEDDARKLVHGELTGIILKCFYFTYDVLGYGFLESVYRKSLAIELRSRGLKVQEEKQIDVKYRGVGVGTFRIDLVVEDIVALELKATSVLGPTDQAQLLNCLKAGSVDVGLLLHFGPNPKFHRLVHPKMLSA